MGMCKKCGLVFNANDMKDGVCQNCEPWVDICKSCGKETETKNMKDGICNICKPFEKSVEVHTETKSNTLLEVSVIDVKMPFMSMVIFMIKWALAAIPAFLILFIIYFTFFSVIFKNSYKEEQNYSHYSSY